MKNLSTRLTTTSLATKSRRSSPLRRGFLLIPLTLASFTVLSFVQASSPPPPPPPPSPDGGLPNGNTVEGTGALFSLTTGVDNTAMGFNALYHNTTGNWNTAYGYQALFSNTTGGTNNVANGSTAVGFQALFSNTTGEGNVANGYQALFNNTTGFINTATGRFALFSDTTGARNTATGGSALLNNTTGNSNTADGRLALFSNTAGNANTANGIAALSSNTTGNGNIALGAGAGDNLDTGDNNIDIGNEGNSGEANTIRIGGDTGFGPQTATFIAGIYGAATSDAASTTAVVIDMNGNLGTAASSERFKKDIGPMAKASEAVLALKPVTFHYKNDSKGVPQFGLVAEEVAKVNPDLVVRDAKGQIYTVRYDAVNAMLLNEFLKAHKRIEQQDKRIDELTARLKQQAAFIQKVSDKVEMSRPAQQTVANN
jgi:endosialidase-like protein